MMRKLHQLCANAQALDFSQRAQVITIFESSETKCLVSNVHDYLLSCVDVDNMTLT